MTDYGPPVQWLKAKHRVGKRTGYKSKHNQQSSRQRRKNGRKDVPCDHTVPVLLDGKRVSRMPYSAWQALDHGGRT